MLQCLIADKNIFNISRFNRAGQIELFDMKLNSKFITFP
jgi:hypothetical protein